MVIYVICLPLSYKLSTGVSSVLVLKRTSQPYVTKEGQHNNRSPHLYVATSDFEYVHVKFIFS